MPTPAMPLILPAFEQQWCAPVLLPSAWFDTPKGMLVYTRFTVYSPRGSCQSCTVLWLARKTAGEPEDGCYASIATRSSQALPIHVIDWSRPNAYRYS